MPKPIAAAGMSRDLRDPISCAFAALCFRRVRAIKGTLSTPSRPETDRAWTVDFVRRFEAHQIERIRRAILAYRDKHGVGDVTLAKELLNHLPKNVTYDSTLKNVQRLRKGEHMRGAAFLNGCVQFLQVGMATPPEEELGLAMKHFVGNVSGYADLWIDLAGDYVLRVLGERDFSIPASTGRIGKRAIAIDLKPRTEQPQSQNVFVVLTIGPGEGRDYGIARERFFLRGDIGPEDEEAGLSEVNALDRKGVCIPVGSQDFLILMRDFLFSHMYVLRREAFGFAGTMILPSAFAVFAPDVPPGQPQSQFDVALHRVPRE